MTRGQIIYKPVMVTKLNVETLSVVGRAQFNLGVCARGGNSSSRTKRVPSRAVFIPKIPDRISSENKDIHSNLNSIEPARNAIARYTKEE